MSSHVKSLRPIVIIIPQYVQLTMHTLCYVLRKYVCTHAALLTARVYTYTLSISGRLL